MKKVKYIFYKKGEMVEYGRDADFNRRINSTTFDDLPTKFKEKLSVLIEMATKVGMAIRIGGM